jgi:hypothetical protein
MRAIEMLEIRAWKENEPCLFCGHRGRGIHAAVEQGQLGHGTSGAFHVKHLLASLRVGPIDAHLTRLDDIQAAALLSRDEEHVPRVHGTRDAPGSQLPDGCFIQIREDRDASEQRNDPSGRRDIHVFKYLHLRPATHPTERSL